MSSTRSYLGRQFSIDAILGANINGGFTADGSRFENRSELARVVRGKEHVVMIELESKGVGVNTPGDSGEAALSLWSTCRLYDIIA